MRTKRIQGALLGLLLAVPALAEVQKVEMKIAGYLCGF